MLFRPRHAISSESETQALDRRQLHDDEKAVWIPEADGWAVVLRPGVSALVDERSPRKFLTGRPPHETMGS